jgi:predicted nucleic acid-binding protein
VTLIDSNVLIDFFIDDPRWSDWSIERLQEAARVGPLLINDVIYAEASTRYQTIDDFEAALVRVGVTNASLPGELCFWPARPSFNIEELEECVPGCYPIFLLVLMLKSNGCRC